MSNTFSGCFADRLEDMLKFKTALGYSRNTYWGQAMSFDKYCSQHFPSETILTKDLAMQWVNARDASGFHGRACFIRGFAEYLTSIGEEAYVLPNKYAGGKASFLPYIFTDKELAEVFHEIDCTKTRDSFQSYLLSVIFRLIYTCGLRPNEGRELRRSSINLQTGEILITETKKNKDRIVVMSDDMRRLATDYAKLRNAAFPDSEYFFPSKTGRPYSASWLQGKFKDFFAAANNDVDPDTLPPVRVYDLRHRFASAALHRWLDEGKDLYSRLPYLRTYMGHKELAATAYYIHLLPENLVKSAGIDWDALGRMIPAGELWDE